jgi:hypothetical protein
MPIITERTKFFVAATLSSGQACKFDVRSDACAKELLTIGRLDAAQNFRVGRVE